MKTSKATIAYLDPSPAATKPARIAEYKKRKRPYEEKRVPASEVAEYENSKWQVVRELKRGVLMRRAKTPDEVLENQFWCLLYLLGYEELNIGRRFFVTVEDDGKTFKRQIDVFAKDKETIVVAECKTADQLKSKRLQRELGDFDSLKRPIANALRAHYGKGMKQKIVWCFVTSRIRWHASDLARAKEARISIITDRELRYYTEMAKALGKAARHQFHAEFLSGQKVPALAQQRVPAIRQKINGKTAYFFTISASSLLSRAFINHRDLRDPSGVPTYQRLVNGRRVKKVANFLESGGFFANSILVNFRGKRQFDISGRDEDGDIQFGRLLLPDTYKSCWIIDGQHRLYGAGSVEKIELDPTLPVIAFETLSGVEEANLFTVINREQKAVAKRLLDELDGELKWDSPQPREAMEAICSRAIDMLANEISGPFEDRIVPSGMKGAKHQTLTLPQVRQAILESGLIGRTTTRDDTFVPGPITGKTGEETLHNLVTLLSDYFTQLRDKNPERWSDIKGLLSNNFGVMGHIRLLGELIPFVCAREKIDAHELTPEAIISTLGSDLEPVLSYVAHASDEEFKERFLVPFGGGGAPQYYFRLVDLIHAKNPAFSPKGFEEFKKNTSEGRAKDADSKVKWIVTAVHDYVISRLKEIYGDRYWEAGVKSKEIKLSAYSKQMDEGEDAKQIETYLDFIELKKIVETSDNWPHFKDTLNIPLDGQQRGLAKYVAWFDQINKIRRVPAHPFGRTYKDEDLKTLQHVEDHLRNKFKAA